MPKGKKYIKKIWNIEKIINLSVQKKKRKHSLGASDKEMMDKKWTKRSIYFKYLMH